MAFCVLTMNNCRKLQERYNEVVDWMFPQFLEINEISVAFKIIKMFQCCVGMVYIFKRRDASGTSICRGSAYDMFLNPTLEVLSSITRGSWNFQG